MEKSKNTLVINLKSCVIIIMMLVMIIFLGFYMGMKFGLKEYKNHEILSSENVIEEYYENQKYYIIKDDYTGDYDIQYITLSEYFDRKVDIQSMFEKSSVMNYEEYKRYCSEWNIDKVYHDNTKNYIVFSYSVYGSPSINARLANVEYENDTAKLYIWDNSSGITADISAYVIVIPTQEKVTNVECQALYTNEEFEKIKGNGTTLNSLIDPDVWVDKPIIYFYPEQETNVLVKLGNSDKLVCSYPKYKDEGWNVIAKPDGNLIDCDSNRNLYSLYYESISVTDFKIEEEGFVVKGEDSAKFLEEKLELLGLNEREAQEFIIYWLPKLESNEYNYIRFASQEEINENMPLEILPTPDSTIRVLMVFKGLDEKIDVKNQNLETPKRNGFTVVEWGGVEIK